MSESLQYPPIQKWLIQHLRAFLSCIGALVRAPFASLMTLMVVGIAMALPSGLFLLLGNLEAIHLGKESKPSISLYVKKGSPDFEIKAFMKGLKRNSQIESLHYISPSEGLAEIQHSASIGEALSQLEINPLPGVIAITPKTRNASPEALNHLLTELKELPIVDQGHLDTSWIKRLYAILTIGERITYALGILFGLGVLLIIGNTIRLSIQNHQQEIIILKLVGATHAFIRRPLLYRGALYGLLGGVLTCLFLELFLWLLASPTKALAETYASSIRLNDLTGINLMIILSLSTLLGLLGAYIASSIQLKALEKDSAQ